MNYKKIIRSREIREKILSLLSFIPDKLMVHIQYIIKQNRSLNLVSPTRFTEKLQYYKIHYRKKVMQKCVDKYSVREYVKSKGLERTLNTIYGVYDNVDYLEIDRLPNQFVIKSTNGGGGINIIICKDKANFNVSYNKDKLRKWLSYRKSNSGREWAYNGLKPRFIIEEYLVNEDKPEAGITDYKFFCFNGKPEYIVVDIDRYTDHKRNFYDKDWTYLDVSSDCNNFGDTFPRPEGLNEMLEVASHLSQDFPFVRVDLYYVNKRVIFGEMTFYPWSGYVQFNPDEFDIILGKSFNLKGIK